jgi:type IV secretory pathway VirD2 relaxase
MDAAGRDASRRHLLYLERDGVDRDGTPGNFYGVGEVFDRAAFEAPLPGEKRQFRFIVSPEDAAQVDLQTFVRELVGQMEKDLGRPLLWAAVDHYNTEHPHAHVVIRGVDAHGRDLFIPERYIQKDLRSRAEQQLTRELGPRTEREIAQQRAREIEHERFTSVDRTIEKLVDVDGRSIDPKGIAKLGSQMRATVVARLSTLARFGLATRATFGRWELAETWKADLFQLGTRGDIIKRLHQVAPADPSRYRFVEPADLRAPIEGLVRAKALHDELTGELFAAVETPRGEVHYVRLPKEAAEFVGEGDIVRVVRTTESWVKSTDQVLGRIAALNRGIYDPEAHLRQLESGGERAAAPQALVAGNLKRLERLERYGLVSRLAGGSWHVPADLVDQLRAREASHPRHKLRVEYAGASLKIQSRYSGPTWLDRQAISAPERAPSGFGAELAAAARDRAAHLLALGLDGRSPEGQKRLESTERLLYGRRRAAEAGVNYDDNPGGARGVLVAGPPLPSGRAFAEVVDARTKRLVLVPWTVETARFFGREVEVAVDPARNITVRPARQRERGED